MDFSGHLSGKLISNQHSDQLIVALDFPDLNSAKAMVNLLGGAVTFYKIGLELLMSGQYFELVEWLGGKNKRIFVDLKLLDIPITIGKAILNLSQYPNIDLLTIHSASRDIMLQAAENKGQMRVVAVTVLTNIEQGDLVTLGFAPQTQIADLVLQKARLTKECGIDGVVASAKEANLIRKELGKDFIIVTPGIRPQMLLGYDQKRAVGIEEAILSGSDYLVVGRPITCASDPLAAVLLFQEEIAKAIQKKARQKQVEKDVKRKSKKTALGQALRKNLMRRKNNS